MSLHPPNAVDRLLEAALLSEIQHSKQNQSGRRQGQQRRLQSVEEARFHSPGVSLHRGESTCIAMSFPNPSHWYHLRKPRQIRNIETNKSLEKSTGRGGIRFEMQKTVGAIRAK